MFCNSSDGMNASYVFGSSYFGSNEWLAPSTAAPAPSGGLFSSKTTAPATGAAPTPATGGLFGAGKETSSVIEMAQHHVSA